MVADVRRLEPSPVGQALSERLLDAQVRLLGEVNTDMVRALREQLAGIPDGEQVVAIEMTTLGGDADIGRHLAFEIELARKRLEPRRLVFLGKSHVYSAGLTVMSAFPREDRFLTRDAVLLIHCRQLEQSVEVSGPLRASLPKLQALCAEMEFGVQLEEEAFRRLVDGSEVGLDELVEKALYNWYVPAEEALRRGLVAGIV